MNSLDPWRLIVTDPSGEVIWPRPYYGHPFYNEIPSWIHYGDDDSTTRQLFDGVFIGADYTEAPMDMDIGRGGGGGRGGVHRGKGVKGHPGKDVTASTVRGELTAMAAPIIAPASGGITFKKELDDKQVLHVEICVDGKCYRTSMDLAPVLAMVMSKLAKWHASQHDGSMPPPHLAKVSGDYVIGCCDRAVDAAGDGMVAALVDRHVRTVCGSFLDDIANTVSSIASPVIDTVTTTLKQFKGPIATAASAAAASGAALIPGVGPIAAPLAGKLANDLVNSTLGDANAKQSVAQAQQQAKTDPTAAAALDEAKKAVAHSTVAHHVRRVGHRARAGHPGAQDQVNQVVADAQRGDPVAQALMSLLSGYFTGQAPTPPVSGHYVGG